MDGARRNAEVGLDEAAVSSGSDDQDVRGDGLRALRSRGQLEVSRLQEDTYDPTKPEFVLPASEAEVAQGLSALRARQAARLAAAVASRSRVSACRKVAGILRHYSEISRELRASASPKKASLVQCPVCLEKQSNSAGSRVMLLTLQCSHQLCCGCAVKCASNGLSSCPVCRHPHLLDPELLSKRTEEWRQQYSRWRSGASKGAAGEVSSVCEPCELGGAPFPDALASRPFLQSTETLNDTLAWTFSLDRTAAHAVISFGGVGDLALAKFVSEAASNKSRGAALKIPEAGKHSARQGAAAEGCGCWRGLLARFMM
jgi:hypothetical protein